MRESGNYTQTYWNNKGKYEDVNKQLAALVPVSGEVKDAANNPALERFRIASNCYYDLYNNGLCNRKAEFRKVFGFASKHKYGDGISQTLIDDTEEVFNVIILDAAKEQGILPKDIPPKLLDIARHRLNIQTLGTRKDDRLDIHEVAVWSLRDALLDAYQAGADSAKTPKRRTHAENVEEALSILNNQGKRTRVTVPEDNNDCNGAGPHKAGEVRLLPTGGGGNDILCRACFDSEMRYRRDAGITVNLPKWETLKVYEY